MAEQTGERSDQPTDSAQAPGWGFWLWWVLASMGVFFGVFFGGFAGGFVGGALQWLVLRRQVARAGWWVLASTVGGFLGAVGGLFVGWVVGGFVGGVLEWLVLRQQVARAGWWVLAGTVGWAVGGFVGFFEGVFANWFGPVGLFVDWVVGSFVYGAITGAMLVWLLRQRAGGAEDTTTAAP